MVECLEKRSRAEEIGNVVGKTFANQYENTESKLVTSVRGLAILAKASPSFAMMPDHSDSAGVNATRTYVALHSPTAICEAAEHIAE